MLGLRAGDAQFAMPVTQIAEVLRVPPLTRVPGAPPALAGLANIRGTVVPVVSLPVALGGAAEGSARARILLVDAADPVAVLVDEVLSLVAGGDATADPALRPFDLHELIDDAFGTLASTRRSVRTAVAESDQLETDDRMALLAFGVADQQFALPLENVVAVMALPAGAAAVPHTDGAMLGMVPWREGLLPLVSLPALLDLPGLAHARQRVVVARIGGASIGLVVDSIHSILRVSPEGIDPVPSVLTRGNAEAEIAGVCRLDEGRRLVSILAADRLLRDGLAERLAEKDTHVNDTGQSSRAVDEGDQFLVFRIGDQSFGMPIDQVAEVTRAPDHLTRLPQAPPFIEGVMNLRGRVLPVIDQRRRFDAAMSDAGSRSRVIVVRIGDSEAGFRVDAVTEVLRVRPDQLVPTPEIAADEHGVIDRVAALDDRMLLLVDPRELLDRAERDMLIAMRGPLGETVAAS